ncbi:MAG: pirin family protein [Cyanobacteria bacterium J06634_6]
MSIEQLIVPEKHDLGGFSVHRSLPHPTRQMVGPFIFFDHLGPAVFPPGEGVDVRPHPHINLATVTYLYEGSLLHRDSLGVVQEILPGEVNWMTAGKGVVHSERSPAAFRDKKATLHAIQTWIALPEEDEEVEPDFTHYGADALPCWVETGTSAVLIAGDYQSYRSPVKTFSPMLYLSLSFTPNSRFQLLPNLLQAGEQDAEVRSQERAAYSLTSGLRLNGEPLPPRQLAVLSSEDTVALTADKDAEDVRCIVIGGAPLGVRYKYWNFVSSRAERIAQAKKDWRAGQFPQVPNENESIPLPDDAADKL